jgi:DNA-binding CsgD family transcriptional regulator
VIDDGRTLLLEERPAGPPTLQAIRSLGLTDRQAQLLRLLAIGRTARQVASDLGISPGTVTKHLENIYTRLGVNTRAQALARIYDRHSPASGGGESVAPRPPTQRRMPVPVVARHRHQRPPARADLRAALNVALVAQAAESVKQLREEILPALRQLVPCDLIGYNEVDLERGNVLGDVHPAEGAFDGIDVAFARVAHQHPLVKRQQAGDLSAQLLSDSLSARQFHRLELYQDFYKLIGTEDQLAFGVPGEVIVAFALSASRPSFTSRDRQLLELVRPHLSAAYRHAREQDRARELVDTLQDALDALGRGLILLYARFEVAQVTETARALLDSYFRPRPVGRTGLPAALDAWIAACACPQRRPNQMTVDGPRGRLCIREQPTTANALRAVILEEQRPNAFELDSLREFGLTQRQAQVLRLVASGKSNGQTAAQLQISVGTVEKHLQHIYDRLGVGSRSQAIARIHEMVALTPGSQPC